MNIEQFKRLPIFSISPEDVDYVEIALVDYPAIEVDFLKFKDEKNTKYTFNSDLMEIKGPVLIPNKLIYREEPTQRYVTFTKENIRKCVEMFMKNGLKFNEDHTDKKANLTIIESYFASEKNEFDVAEGSWIITAKVNDVKLWEDIKFGTFKGFSFEGLFSNKFLREEDFNKNNNKEMELKEKIMNALNNILFNEDVKVEEKVEDVKTEETFVDAPVLESAPAVPETEDVEILTEEKVKAMIDESAMSILDAVKVMLEEYKTSSDANVVEMKKEIEKFGNQPLTTPIVEVLDTKSTNVSKYSYLTGLNM